MKKSRFTEEQIAFALKQNELGVSVEEVSRKIELLTTPKPRQCHCRPMAYASASTKPYCRSFTKSHSVRNCTRIWKVCKTT